MARILTLEQAKLLRHPFGLGDDHEYWNDPSITPLTSDADAGGWVVKKGYDVTLPDAPYEDAKLLANAEVMLETIIYLYNELQK